MSLQHHANLEKEVAYRSALGMIVLSLPELESKVRELGYRFDVREPKVQSSFPMKALRPIQLDDGICFADENARRDERFYELTEIRNQFVAVHDGYLCEW
jgi:hypothetical protein